MISPVSQDHKTVGGVQKYGEEMRNVFAMQNVTSNDRCTARASNASDCMFAANVAPHVKSALYIVNSFYDSWSLSNILALKCFKGVSTCTSSELTAANEFRSTFLSEAVAFPRPNRNIYLYSCFTHVHLTITDKAWTTFRIANGTAFGGPGGLLEQWVFGSATWPQIDCEDKKAANCNSLCPTVGHNDIDWF